LGTEGNRVEKKIDVHKYTYIHTYIHIIMYIYHNIFTYDDIYIIICTYIGERRKAGREDNVIEIRRDRREN